MSKTESQELIDKLLDDLDTDPLLGSMLYAMSARQVERLKARWLKILMEQEHAGA